MTRKDIKIADALNADKPVDMDSGYTWWPGTVKRIADALAADNPRFNRDKFYQACGLVDVTADDDDSDEDGEA